MKLIILCLLSVAVLGLGHGANGENERTKYVIFSRGTTGYILAKNLSDDPSNDVIVINTEEILITITSLTIIIISLMIIITLLKKILDFAICGIYSFFHDTNKEMLYSV